MRLEENYLMATKEPVMNRLAYGSLVLSPAYSTPSCSPSRATVLTGQNPLHHAILRPSDVPRRGRLAAFPPIRLRRPWQFSGVRANSLQTPASLGSTNP